MAVTIQEAFKMLQLINLELHSSVNKYGYYADEVNYNAADPEESFLHDEIGKISNLLNEASHKIDYLNKSVVDEGPIYRNSAGRYEMPSGHYFTSGSVCEIYYYDTFMEKNVWRYTTIEHSGDDYYANVLGKEVSIENLRVRIRS